MRAASARAFPSAIGGLLALAIAVGIGRFVYTPILPPMLAALNMTVFAGGLIASANYLGYFAGALAVSGSRLPGPHHAWLAFALLASAATTAAMGIPSTLPAFLILRFAGGVASAFVLILASTAALQHLDEQHSRLNPRRHLPSILFAGVGTGITASAILVSALTSAGAGWRALWGASGALAFAGALGALVLIPPRSPRASGPISAAKPNPAPLARLIISYGLYGFGYVITATFIVTMVRRQPELRPLEPVIWIIFGLAAAPSIALWMAIGNRAGIPLAYAIACLVEAAGVAASVTGASFAGIVAASVLVGGTFVGITALGLVHARTLTTGDSRRALAFMTSAFGLGQIIGPSLAGALAQHLGSFAAPSALAAAALVAAAVLALV